MMEFKVLGPVRIRHDSATIELAGRMQRILLGVLLTHANRTVDPEVLIDALWQGERVSGAVSRLQVHIHRLRRSLDEPERLRFGPGGYRLRVAAGELDAEQFEAFLERAEDTTDPHQAAALLRDALDLWQGPPYEGLEVEVLTDEAHRWEALRQAATEALYAAELARGRHAAVLADLTDLVRRAPLRERPQALLVQALHRSGRRAEALQTYDTARSLLAEELGLDPGPELRAAQSQVLADDQERSVPESTGRMVPRQLPPAGRGFVGRRDALDNLDRLLEEERTSSQVVVVTGTPGVGKSALAAQWSHRVVDRFPDGQLWIDLQGYGPSPPARSHDVLAAFLRALGVSGPEVPTDAAEREARFRSLTGDLQLLVVLDNASTAEQVRPLLPAAPSCLVLITGRDVLGGLAARDGAHRVDLDQLTPTEATELLENRLGPDVVCRADRSAVAALVSQCARLPLALRIAAEVLRGPPERGIDELASALADEQQRVGLLQLGDDPHSALPVVFSWSYQQLPDDAATLFRVGGLHPGGSTDLTALAAMADLPVAQTRRALAVLVRTHLVDVVDGRYGMHDLLHAYARHLAERIDTVAGRAAAIDRLLEHHLSRTAAAMDLIAPHEASRRPAVRTPTPTATASATKEDAHRWLDAERATLLGLAQHTGRDRAVVDLSGLLWRYLLDGAHLHEAVSLHTAALASARRLGDRRAEADANQNLAAARYYLTDHERGEVEGQRALALYTELGDRSLQAAALNTLGGIAALASRYPQALQHFQQVANLYDDLGDDVHAAWAQGNLGKLRLRLGEYDGARSLLDRALRASRELGFPEAYRARVLCALAQLSRRTGDLGRAAGQAEEALAVSRACGARTVEAAAMVQLGCLERRRGDLAASAATLREAAELFRRFGDRFGEAEALNRLGRTHRCAEDPIRAMRAHQEGLDVAEALGSSYEQANALSGLADAYAAIGDQRRARDHRECALARYDALGVPEAEVVRARQRTAGAPMRA